VARAVVIAVLAAMLAAPAPAFAGQRFQAPMQLPGDVVVASAAPAGDWIIGARPGPQTDAVANRFGIRAVAGGQAFVVPWGRARALADALGPRLLWAEPDAARTRVLQAPDADPVPTPWRDRITRGRAAPPPSAQSPLIGLVDSPIHTRHPEFATGNVRSASRVAARDVHGTATAAIAVAARDGVGMIGVWPGAPLLGIPLPAEPFTCQDSAIGIRRAIQAGAKVINMSYGSSAFCFLEYVQLQLAVRRGITLVAAAGNEHDRGNQPQFPGAMPHVLTVAALDSRDRPSFFSNANAAIDLAAPGERIVSAVPPDAYRALDGTSFAAPMVSGAAAWVRAERPELSADQVAQVLRLGARDLGRPGWQPDSGFGILDVGGALDRPPPPRDPLEPNDDVVWVNGTFGKPHRFLFTGGPARLHALLDRFEDPVDVYRVRFPARSRTRVTIDPHLGDPDLRVLDRRARHVDHRRFVLAESRRSGTRRDSVVIRNSSRRARGGYVAVRIKRSARLLDSAYTVRVRRVGR
jgi:hypothetical protein